MGWCGDERLHRFEGGQMSAVWDEQRRVALSCYSEDVWRRAMTRFLHFVLPVPVERALLLGVDDPGIAYRHVEVAICQSGSLSALQSLERHPKCVPIAGPDALGAPLPWADGSFDLILSLHRFPDLDTLGEWRRLLKPGGIIALFVPNCGLEEGGNPIGVSDYEVGGRLARLGLIGVRTSEALDGAYLMAKGRSAPA